MIEHAAIALSSRALIEVRGPDWRAFLQGLLSNDVEALPVGEARFAGLLTPQGRLLYDLFVVAREDGAWLDVQAAWRDALVQRLMIYRLRARVEIRPLDLPVAAALSQPCGDVCVLDPRLSELGWRAYGVQGGQAEPVYDLHRLSFGVPGPADWGTDKTYPIEANFDLLGGINFHKGCFVGQETTSRMHRRGAVKSRMIPITFDGVAPAPGSEILNGDLRSGEVLSGQYGRAMASLRLDRMAGDLTVDGRAVRADPPGWMPLQG